MKNAVLSIAVIAALSFGVTVQAEESHGHDEKEGQGHSEEKEHGPDPDKGFEISAAAEKNFEISRVTVRGSQVEIPNTAIVTAGTERNLFRYREGHYRRVDFQIVSRNGNKILVKSNDLQSGDEIVIAGTGFLRIAEISAFGGAPEGHSH